MSDERLKRTVLTFAAGAAAGGVAALLFAPMKGEDLRHKIAEEAEAKKNAAGDKIKEVSHRTGEKVNDLSDRARGKARELSDRASAQLSRARNATGEVVSRGKGEAKEHGEALSAAVRAGLEAYEQSLNGRR